MPYRVPIHCVGRFFDLSESPIPQECHYESSSNKQSFDSMNLVKSYSSILFHFLSDLIHCHSDISPITPLFISLLQEEIAPFWLLKMFFAGIFVALLMTHILFDFSRQTDRRSSEFEPNRKGGG